MQEQIQFLFIVWVHGRWAFVFANKIGTELLNGNMNSPAEFCVCVLLETVPRLLQCKHRMRQRMVMDLILNENNGFHLCI